MPRLSVVPGALPSTPSEARDAELRRIVHDLADLLVAIVGDAYALRAALPNGSARRGVADIEAMGQRAGVLMEQLAALLADGPVDLPEDWETD